MKETTWMVIAAAVLVGGVACSEAKKSGPEAALDRAFQSGILSQDEYQAKKAALLASATVPAAAPQPAAPAPAPVPDPVPPPAPAAVSASVDSPAAPKPAPAPARAARPAEPTTPPVEAPQPAAASNPIRPAPAACEDSESRPGKEKDKQERFYPMPPSRVRAALLKSLTDLDFQVHTDTGTRIEASRKRHIGLVVGHGGEKVTLQLEEVTEGRQRGTRVTGETKKNFVMRAGQKSWTNAVLDQTGCLLHTSGRAAGLAGGKDGRQSTD